jgi:hypothetical protein
LYLRQRSNEKIKVRRGPLHLELEVADPGFTVGLVLLHTLTDDPLERESLRSRGVQFGGRQSWVSLRGSMLIYGQEMVRNVHSYTHPLTPAEYEDTRIVSSIVAISFSRF